MRTALTIAAAALAAALSILPVAAQDSGVAQPDAGYDGSGAQQQPILPPSAAVKRAMRAVPGAEPLGVKLRGEAYVVRLKQDGTILQVEVDALTGEVMPLQ